MMVSIYLLLVFLVGYSYQLNNGLGKTPQMGKINLTDAIKA
jgi:hypothetical protein